MARRGFVFTLDALLSVITLVGFLTAIYFLSSQAPYDAASGILMKKRAGDALAVLDASGVLATVNETAINSSLEQMMTEANGYRATFDYYYYWNDGFDKIYSLEIGTPQQASSNAVMSQREFLVFESSRIKYYGIGRIWIWEK